MLRVGIGWGNSWAERKDWKRDESWKTWEHEREGGWWGNVDGKWGDKDWEDEGERVWSWGRRNEMIAKGFKYNTHWKEIKTRTEEIMGVSEASYG